MQDQRPGLKKECVAELSYIVQSLGKTGHANRVATSKNKHPRLKSRVTLQTRPGLDTTTAQSRWRSWKQKGVERIMKEQEGTEQMSPCKTNPVSLIL